MNATQHQPVDDQFINGLLTNDYRILNAIYEQYLPGIISMVRKNNGSEEEARDIFQEGLIVLFKKASEPDFKLTTSLFNYFYGICRFLWLRQLKKSYRQEVTIDAETGYIMDDADIEATMIAFEKRQLIRQKLCRLCVDCQTLMEDTFEGKTLKEIARKMGYTEQYARKKKCKCKNKLIELVKNDQRYKELVNSANT